jgi:hypothetical protein
MSKISLSGNASGTGTLTIAAPNTNSDATINLPTVTGGAFIVSNASGNVGIGTDSPAYKLDIRSAQDDATNFLLNGLNIVNTSNQGAVANKTAIRLGVLQDAGVRAAKIVAEAEGGGATNNIALSFRTNTANADDSTTEGLRITGAGLLQFNSGYGSVATAFGCRAWVNFDGTGTVAIRASGNVSSISDTGTGRYTVNFTTAMPDANYAVTSLSDGDGYVQINNAAAYSTTAVAVAPNNMSNAGTDRAFMSVAIFR